MKIVTSKPNKKSTGTDSMPFFIVKKFDYKIFEHLTSLFNHLLAISYFPSCWKLALMTSIPKLGKDNTILDNWRPISQLNSISKVFEKIIAVSLNQTEFKTFPSLFSNQFGFLGGISTEHALGRLQNDIICGLNTKRITSIVALDFGLCLCRRYDKYKPKCLFVYNHKINE